jgi:hypothetical protein
MSAANSEVLAKAVEHHSPAVISAGEGKDRRDVLVQFTTARTDASAVGFWARVHHGDVKLVDRLIRSGADVGVSFNTNSAKINFRTALLKRRRRFLVHKLLLLRWPEKISVVEQRQKPRVWVPDRYRMTARAQTISATGEVMSEAAVRVWDLGLEGASLICPTEPFGLSLGKEASVRLMIRLPDSQQEHVYPASQRHVTQLSDQKLRLGVQFTQTPDVSTEPAKQVLQMLVNELDQASRTYRIMAELHRGMNPNTTPGN